MNSIRDLPGVGHKTAERLISSYGSENAAMDAIVRGDVAGIAQSCDISPRQAAAIVQAGVAMRDGVQADGFLCTNEARAIYNDMMDMIRSHAKTQYGKENVAVFFPCGSIDRIRRVQAEVETWRKQARQIDSVRAQELLGMVRPLREPAMRPIRNRVFLTSDPQIAEKARDHRVEVCTVSSPEEYVDVAGGYGWIYVDHKDPLSEVDLPEEVVAEYIDTERVEHWWTAPENILRFYAHNRDSILAALEIRQLLEPSKDIGHLIGIIQSIGDDGGLAGGVHPEVDRLSQALSSLDEVVSEESMKATEELRRVISESELSIGGAEVLGLLEKGATDIRPLIESRITQSYQEVIKEAELSIMKRLGLSTLDVKSLFSHEIEYPIKTRGVDRLRLLLRGKKTGLEMKMLREAARELNQAGDLVREALRAAFELDLHLAVAEFTREMTMPDLRDDLGLSFEEAFNLQILNEYGPGGVTPVTYGFERGAVLLSGVNSGGKTSVLNLISQVVILAHMGFPVPAQSARVGVVDGLYYFAKSRGTLDAGAFESTLRQFSALGGAGLEIVLADELESITEPGASARIIAGILESIHEAGGCAVFVSHLAETIREHAGCPLRIDGIEASGLDENLNLIVDRSPRQNYLAKSTPQLILERLARGSGGENRAFYERMLGKFRERT